jgi:hypothetical protein
MTDDDFTKDLGELIQEGIDKKIDPFVIIGFLEATKVSIINNLLGVPDVYQ